MSEKNLRNLENKDAETVLFPLSSKPGRDTMEEETNLDNTHNELTTEQAAREFTTPEGCHVKVFFRKEYDPAIRKEVARLLLAAFEQERNEER